jgi:hypothetical protein
LVEDGNMEDEVSSTDDVHTSNYSKDNCSHCFNFGKTEEKMEQRLWIFIIEFRNFSVASNSTPPSNSMVKSPKLELKHFNGNIMVCTPFWDLYSSIHENPNLSDIDKFNYLHSKNLLLEEYRI